MILKAFAVFDCKALAYMTPWFCRTSGEALRLFKDIVNDGKSPWCLHPADYSLWYVGSFDDSDGHVMSPENSGKCQLVIEAIAVVEDVPPLPVRSSLPVPDLSSVTAATVNQLKDGYNGPREVK